jgi:ribosome recycling factor
MHCVSTGHDQRIVAEQKNNKTTCCRAGGSGQSPLVQKNDLHFPKFSYLYFSKNVEMTVMETQPILDAAKEKMKDTLAYLEDELANIRAGKATTNVLNGVMVDYYGSQSPVNQVASVTVPDARTVLVAPWDKKMIPAIEKAILVSNIGLTPSNNGEQIRLSIPPLTEERRKSLVKQVKTEGENARISLRNARRDAVEAFKKAQKEGMPEDMAKDGEEMAQKLVEKYSKQIDEQLAAKEKEIMTV